MNAKQFVAALAVIGVVVLLVPEDLHAWTPATHIYLGKSVLSQVHQLAPAVAELLRAFPFDFLYGNIAADSSIAKSYAPVSRHCHHWHVGQEIYDHAPNDALRAFGLGYMAHLSADTVAHNYFVPRQLALTSSTASVGHAYWEARFEAHLGDAYAAEAKEIIQLDHNRADDLLDRIISPTIFSVRTNRRLFRGMVHLTQKPTWQRAFQVARERSRWDLANHDIGRHMARSFDFIMEVLAEMEPAARLLDPSGTEPLKLAKHMRRETLQDRGHHDLNRLHEMAEQHFGLPERPLAFWTKAKLPTPWEAAHNGSKRRKKKKRKVTGR